MKEVPLTRGYVALVDDEDFQRVSEYRWHVSARPYANYAQASLPTRNGKQPRIFMHRLILGLIDPKVYVDHINHDGLDNRRENLRTCTNAQNQHNRRAQRDSTSGVKGVYWKKQRGKWRAQIMAGGVAHHLGYFSDKQSAATAYAEAAHKLHGEFANQHGTGLCPRRNANG